jgi:hypothetical protein
MYKFIVITKCLLTLQDMSAGGGDRSQAYPPLPDIWKELQIEETGKY